MTTSRLNQRYQKGTETSLPKIFVQTRFPFLLMLKLMILGEYAHVEHELTEAEIESLSRSIVKWRLIKNLRDAKHRAKNK